MINPVLTQPTIKLSKSAQKLLCCPICRSKLEYLGQEFACCGAACGSRFPIVDGVPVLLNEKASLFSITDVLSDRQAFFSQLCESRLRRTMRRLLPGIGKNIKAKQNYKRLKHLLLSDSNRPLVLVVGGGISGNGVKCFSDGTVDLVESDIGLGPGTILICDAHDIPFEDNSFDGVIIQAVLEHVVDPYRCVAECHRVLKDRGIVYAEIPFMQQVHGEPFDFTRFTYLGLRRLFRKFHEVESGPVCGPGMALAWSYQHFLLSFTTSRVMRRLVRVFSSLTSFYLKYLDYYLIDKPNTLNSASGYYFMGRKSNDVLSDRELIRTYADKQKSMRH